MIKLSIMNLSILNYRHLFRLVELRSVYWGFQVAPSPKRRPALAQKQQKITQKTTRFGSIQAPKSYRIGYHSLSFNQIVLAK